MDSILVSQSSMSSVVEVKTDSAKVVEGPPEEVVARELEGVAACRLNLISNIKYHFCIASFIYNINCRSRRTSLTVADVSK